MWRKPAIWILMLGLFLLGFSAYEQSIESCSLEQKRGEIIRRVENDIEQLNKALVAKEAELFDADDAHFLRICDSLQLLGVRYQKGTPQIWNNHDFQLANSSDVAFQILEQNGVYLAVWNRKREDKTFVVGYNVFNLDFPEINTDKVPRPKLDLFLGTAPVEESQKINFKGPWIGATEWYLVLFGFQYPESADRAFIFGLICLSIAIYLLGLERSNRHFAWLNVGLWMLFLLLEMNGIILKSAANWDLFSTDIFHYNFILNHLFSTAVWFLIGFWLIRFSVHHITKWSQEGWRFISVLSRLIFAIIAVFLTLFAFHFTTFLVEKTEIHFRFSELLLLSSSSFTAMGLLALLFASILSVIHFLQRQARGIPLKGEWWIYLVGVTLMILWANQFCSFRTIILSSLFLAVMLVRVALFKEIPLVFRWITEIVLPCLLISISVAKSLHQEELKQREFFASSLTLEPDSKIKFILADAESGLNKDLPIFWSLGFPETKLEEFENTLKQEYFSELLENYGVSIFTYNTTGNAMSTNKSADFGSLNALYLSDRGIQVTKQFYLVNERRLSGSYIGKFQVFSDSLLTATYFILVSPEASRAKGRLTDVFNNSPSREIAHRNNYSYAVYNGQTLSKHSGDYNYPLTLNWPIKASKEMTYVEPNFHHIIREDAYGNLIVVSRPKPNWVVGSIQYTLFIFGGILIAILFYSWLWLEERLRVFVNPKFWNRNKFEDANMIFSSGYQRESWFISRRLQIYIVWLLISIFGIVLYTTINYFIINNSERQSEELSAKVNQIANRISGQSNLDALVNQYEVGLIYDMAETFQTDINIFDRYGQLIVSTNPRLYREQYRSNLMNPLAHRKFKYESASTFVLNEHIAELEYISAYSAINDNNLNIRGFVNLPYYSNRVELYRQISTYLVTVVNVFVLLFALVYMITQMVSSRITQPLLFIRDEISRMKLGVRNEPILWERNDEIGLLVAEYNKMIDALDDSLNRLSEVERQGAWREMAKQVAHEIKNPLTPMRLSLQHLEYSMMRNDDNIREKTAKTIKLLIKQIDSLSSMAEEFSSFAKMPEPKLNETDVVEVLQDAATLMEREMGGAIAINASVSQVWLIADAHQLGRVFNNLFKNALQAIPDGREAKVEVALRVVENHVIITVRDNGKGIEEELKDKIFSPNFSTKNSGMGLGLAITKKIIEQFQGSITFESQLDIGTTFTLEFPVLRT